MASTLHALHNKDVFLEHFFPLAGVARAQFGIGLFARIIEVDVLYRPLWALRHKNDRKRMVAVNAQQHVRIGSDVFCSSVPLGAEAVKVGEDVAIL